MFWLGFIIGGSIGMFLTCMILGSIINDRGEDQ